jgi:hypothetical protein
MLAQDCRDRETRASFCSLKAAPLAALPKQHRRVLPLSSLRPASLAQTPARTRRGPASPPKSFPDRHSAFLTAVVLLTEAVDEGG